MHGFFVIGCPGETAEDIQETRFAARLELDTFGFNRLAVTGDAALERVRRQGDHRRRPGLGQDVQVLRH